MTVVFFLTDAGLEVARLVALFAAAVFRAGADRAVDTAFFAVAFFTAGARRSGLL